jgi:hypothetical protein
MPEMVQKWQNSASAVCHKDSLQSGYKIGDGQTLTCSKHCSSLKRIALLLPKIPAAPSYSVWGAV